jgi:hypothetical protein
MSTRLIAVTTPRTRAGSSSPVRSVASSASSSASYAAGQPSKPEFGVKASIVTTNSRAPGGQFVLRVIGHLKSDGHLGRCYPKGYEGDAHAVLSAVGHNLRLVLAWLRTLLCLILIALRKITKPPPEIKSAS